MIEIDKNLILTDKEIQLRCLYLQNLSPECIVEITNDINMAKYIGHTFPSPYTVKDATDFLLYSEKAWSEGTEYIYAIFIDNVYAGNIGIKVNMNDNIVSNIGYLIGKNFEGHGYMTRIVSIMLEYCFNILNLRKIEGCVYSGNIGSMKVLERNGFVCEGKSRKNYISRTGEILDKYLFGILKEEWLEKIKFDK